MTIASLNTSVGQEYRKSSLVKNYIYFLSLQQVGRNILYGAKVQENWNHQMAVYILHPQSTGTSNKGIHYTSQSKYMHFYSIIDY